MAERAGCLTGLRVVDLSTSVVGLQATQHLADNGADVILVEQPGGSPWRAHPSWSLWMRGKRTRMCDLRTPRGRQQVRDLAAGADVLVETFRPGVADSFGVGYEALSASSPQLIYGSVTGFGPTGRYAHVPAYEGVVMAAMGIMHAYSAIHPRQGPVFASPLMCSASATQVLLHGILAALLERSSSGAGQHVETSLVEAVASQDLNNFTHLFLERRYPDAFEGAPFISPEGVPNSGMAFRTLVALTKDGRWLQFGQLSDRLFRALLRALELEWMFDDERWKTAPEFEDVATRLEFWERMLKAARQKTLAEWLAIFEADRDVWAEIYRRGSELLDHPQLVFDRRVASVEAGDRTVKVPGLLVHLDRTPGEAASSTARVDPEGGFDGASWPRRDRGAETAVGPLTGVTILELGMYFAGPLAATMLADLGARVIKVESFEGDPGRSFTGFPEAGGTRTMQGKESIAVDLGTEAGRQIVRDLAARADVVLQSFRAGVAERLGVDAASLMRLNPGVIYVDAPGYGTGGPCGDRPSFAPTIGAASGFALRNVGPSLPERPDLSLDEIKRWAARLFPATIVVGHADAFAAHAVATAILLGIVARGRGLGSQRLETSMLSSMAHVLSDQMVDDQTRTRPVEPDVDMFGAGALYRLYETASGWVFLAVAKEREWSALVDALGDSRLRDLRFADAASRSENDPALQSILESILRSGPGESWEELLMARGVACVVAREATPAQVLMDNLLGADVGLTVDVVHPLWDEHPRLAPAIRLSRSATFAPPGCLCGQHTDALLDELGYDATDIDKLRKAGIVQ